MPVPKQMLEAALASARVKIADDGLSGLLTCFDTDGYPLSYTIHRETLERLGDQIQRN
jgi:hypothetical protein